MINPIEPRFIKNPGIIRFIDVGRLSKLDLLKKLKKNSISLNPLAEQLFESSHFTTSKSRIRVATIEITVEELGFHHGVNISDIYSKAKTLGLRLCPLELAPHFRLQHLDQLEGHCGEMLYHASLSPQEYQALLREHGFEVLLQKMEDPQCNGHSVWVARKSHLS